MKSKIFQIVFAILLIGAVIITVLFKVDIIAITPSSVCLKEGEKQQFEASVEGVQWSVESLIKSNSSVEVATINQEGLLTAISSGIANVVASKGGKKSYAGLSVVPTSMTCNTSVQDDDENNEEDENGDENAENTEKTDGEGGPISGDSVGINNKWSVEFDASLAHEVNNGFEEIGTANYDLRGGFVFTVDYATGELKIVNEPAGFVKVVSSNDVPTCTTSTVNDPFLFVTATDGKLQDNSFVFGKNFITSDHNEGMKMSCMHTSFSDPNASLISILGQYAFPITVDAADGATSAIQGSFSFSGREARIVGILTVHRVQE